MKTLTPSEVKSRLSQLSLIDVPTPTEFAEVHIPGSRLVPLHTLNEARAQELASSDPECVLICQSGKRALRAAQTLVAAGSKSLAVLEGGITAWEFAGHEVVRGSKTLSIERQVRIVAGALVVAGLILSQTLSPWFLLLSGFIGCGLIFAGLTDWCGLGLLLARMPWNNRRSDILNNHFSTKRCGSSPSN